MPHVHAINLTPFAVKNDESRVNQADKSPVCTYHLGLHSSSCRIGYRGSTMQSHSTHLKRQCSTIGQLSTPFEQLSGRIVLYHTTPDVAVDIVDVTSTLSVTLFGCCLMPQNPVESEKLPNGSIRFRCAPFFSALLSPPPPPPVIPQEEHLVSRDQPVSPNTCQPLCHRVLDWISATHPADPHRLLFWLLAPSKC